MLRFDSMKSFLRDDRYPEKCLAPKMPRVLIRGLCISDTFHEGYCFGLEHDEPGVGYLVWMFLPRMVCPAHLPDAHAAPVFAGHKHVVQQHHAVRDEFLDPEARY